VLNILGLGVGKWLNNMGAIERCSATVLIVWNCDLDALRHHRDGGRFSDSREFPFCSEFLRCDLFRLVGLELASVMGDESLTLKKLSLAP